MRSRFRARPANDRRWITESIEEPAHIVYARFVCRRPASRGESTRAAVESTGEQTAVACVRARARVFTSPRTRERSARGNSRGDVGCSVGGGRRNGEAKRRRATERGRAGRTERERHRDACTGRAEGAAVQRGRVKTPVFVPSNLRGRGPPSGGFVAISKYHPRAQTGRAVPGNGTGTAEESDGRARPRSDETGRDADRATRAAKVISKRRGGTAARGNHRGTRTHRRRPSVAPWNRGINKENACGTRERGGAR